MSDAPGVSVEEERDLLRKERAFVMAALLEWLPAEAVVEAQEGLVGLFGAALRTIQGLRLELDVAHSELQALRLDLEGRRD